MILQVRNCNKLLLTALLIGAVSTASAGTSCGTNLEYEMNGTTLVLSSPDPASPAKITSSAFENNLTITKVIIPENVDEVMYHAFYGCSSLVSVLCRPTTAPTLGADAFTGCHASLLICVPTLGAYGDTDWDTSYGAKLTLCFLDENNEETITSDQIKHIRDTYHQNDIDIFRTLRKAGSFNTLTLPFNVPDIESSPLTGAEVYTFSSATVENGTLQLEIEKVTSNSLTAGVPYLIQWPNTGEVLNHMYFSGITWDDNQTADDAGTGQVTYHGFYGRTHITDATNGEQHLNLFLGGNNTLYWPTDGDEASAKMLGFRAWFQIANSGASLSPIRKGMPASFRIVSTPTDVEPVTGNPSPEKVLENGHLIIIRNGEQYSITGQKL